MRIEFAKKGNQNKKYISMVAVSEERDSHWRNENNESAAGINIMFKHSEICSIVENLIAVEPRKKRDQFVKMLIKSIRAGNGREEINSRSDILFVRDNERKANIS